MKLGTLERTTSSHSAEIRASFLDHITDEFDAGWAEYSPTLSRQDREAIMDAENQALEYIKRDELSAALRLHNFAMRVMDGKPRDAR